MSDGPTVAPRPAMVYCYDGTLWGLLCCVYDSYTRREQVMDILTEEGTLSLYPTRTVETDEAHARRIYNSLTKALGPEGLERVLFGARHCDPERAIHLFRFICMGYRHGPAVCGMLGNESVLRVYKLHRTVWHEAHLLLGFVRFREVALEPSSGRTALPSPGTVSLPAFSGKRKTPAYRAAAPAAVAKETTNPDNLTVGAAKLSTNATYMPAGATNMSAGATGLAAVIEPKHDVLPLMAEHFCGRYPEERFLIFDRTHKLALVYEPYRAELVPMEEFQIEETTAEEALCRRLWKMYYDTIAIEARTNPKCRMTHMAKRFWPNLTEM